MRAIVVVDENWAIGNGGELLAHLPGDLKYFKEKTIGKTVIMGRNTLESLPGAKPLPGRANIVLSRNSNYKVDCLLCSSVEKVLEAVKDRDGELVYAIGGAETYRQFLPYCDCVYVTKIEGKYQADSYFVNLDLHTNWEMVWESKPKEENGVTYRFTEYHRTGPQKADGEA